jgi:hypothetical protein
MPPGVLPMLIYITIKNLHKMNLTLHAKLDDELRSEYGDQATITYGPSGTTITTHNKRDEIIRLSSDETKEKLQTVIDASLSARKSMKEKYRIEFSQKDSRSQSTGNPLSARTGSPMSTSRSTNHHSKNNDTSTSGNTLKVPTRK